MASTSGATKSIQILSGLGAGVILVVLIISTLMRGAVVVIGDKSEQVTRTVQHLDSVDSLRMIIYTLSREFQVSEGSLHSALDTIYGFLVLVCCLVLLLLVMVVVQARRLAIAETRLSSAEQSLKEKR